MRLIDADSIRSFLSQFPKFNGEPLTEREKELINCVAEQIVGLMPTAYDVDKVVAELEENRTEANYCTGSYEDYDEYHQGELNAYTHAIDIVKRGGIDE